MTSVSNIDRLIQTLRARSLERTTGQTPSHRSSVDGRKSQPATRSSVEHLVLAQIRAINPDDAQRRRRTFRAFLEGNLLDLFGAAALGDPSFAATLDQIEHVFNGDEELRRAMERAIDTLLAAVEQVEGDLTPLSRVFSL